jgi:hypothetical protein
MPEEAGPPGRTDHDVRKPDALLDLVNLSEKAVGGPDTPLCHPPRPSDHAAQGGLRQLGVWREPAEYVSEGVVESGHVLIRKAWPACRSWRQMLLPTGQFSTKVNQLSLRPSQGINFDLTIRYEATRETHNLVRIEVAKDHDLHYAA